MNAAWKLLQSTLNNIVKCFLIDFESRTIDVPVSDKGFDISQTVLVQFYRANIWKSSNALENFQHAHCSAGFMWVRCTYQDILLIPRLELHGSSVLGSTSKAATASAAYEAEFCYWKVSDDVTWSHGFINKDKMIWHCQIKQSAIQSSQQRCFWGITNKV